MLTYALRRQLVLRRAFATSARREADFTHAVIGGGAVGLAIARQLAAREGTSTVLIERNARVGEETSSRNSEVIHAGLYYGSTSLKTKLCIRGRHLLYDFCAKYSIPAHNMGKWIVAQTDQQLEELHKIHSFTQSLPDGDVPTHFLSLDEAKRQEPDVRAMAGVLVSPSTGILDSHAYMQFLCGDFQDRGGDVALNSPVISIRPVDNSSSSSSSTTPPGHSGWEITTRDRRTREESSITSETIINSAGLGACDINNMILPPSRHKKPYYAKGNYFSYNASSPRTKHLIYPAPEPGLGGLGTHLTLDIAGQIRFGPDVEWVDDPSDLSVNDSRLAQAVTEIKKFLPGIKEGKLRADYAGIRPKLGRNSAVASGRGFMDFVIRREEGFEGFVNLLGIESPGLTSSLAIAEVVEGLLYR